MDILRIIVQLAGAALAIAVMVFIAWGCDRIRARRPRSVQLSDGLYFFEEDQYQDVGLEWRPVEELFR